MRISILGLALLGVACVQPARLVKSDAERVLASVTLDAPNPGVAGDYAIGRFYYGSGTDRRRPEFRDSVLLRTRSVNATPFLRGVDKKEAKKRWKYWGFDEKALPLNGRVWYPVGEGPFPLVLIVHGNHGMKEFSDPGYAYLGELFASRGFITVSVDENFINGGMRTENDARGWILLKHLEAWREMEGDGAFPLKGNVDLDRIALIGHSRGGEAVAVASEFNRLAHYPDDARVRFDFNFGVRTVIAISPVDGQYRPADKLPPVRGVNYLVVHGSHDSDVSTFSGQRTYLRTDVSDPAVVKAALYIYRANHGQFNTVWGDNDVGPAGWLLAKRSLISGEEQRAIGRVFFTGFLEMTLHGQRAYEPMFRDYRTVGGWLPKTMYVSSFASGSEQVLATYEEDVDVASGTMPGVRITTHGLATWREGVMATRATNGGGNFASNTAVVGWSAPTDTASPPDPMRAWYALTVPDAMRASRPFTAATSLTFEIVDVGQKPSPLSPADTAAPRDARTPAVAAGQTSTAKPAAKPAAKPKAKPAPKKPARGDLPADSIRVDLTVELVLADGRVASVPLSSVVALRPPLTIRLYKYSYIERKITGPPRDHEYVLQRVEIPFARFAERLPGFTPEDVRAVRFRFDRSMAGTILLDDIGFESRR